MTKEFVAVHFQCSLTSPFHTTQRKYQNLLKCAPYILGTTFRGAILGSLIEKNCTSRKIDQLKRLTDKDQIDEFHKNCEDDCLVKEFFKEKANIQFSFGTFEQEKYLQITRIALTREYKTAAEGALINIECVRENSKFTFEVILSEQLVENMDEIIEAVEFSGKYSGIGSFKSVGFGKYEVENVTRKRNLIGLLDASEFKNLGDMVEIQFDTPLVFRMESLDEVLIAETISEYLHKRCCEIMQSEAKRISLKDVSFCVKPEFVHRYSLETSQKVNRLVLEKGSRIKFGIESMNDERSKQFNVGSRFGIGEWSNYGFGRFHRMGGKNGEKNR